MGRKKVGFTLIEILAAVAIVGVLAAIAIPGFGKTKTKAEKNSAIAYLRTIRTAEKMYYGKWRTYMALANTAAMKNSLDIEASLPGYTFVVTTASTVAATAFTATATDSDSKTLILNQDGTWSGTNTPLPPS